MSYEVTFRLKSEEIDPKFKPICSKSTLTELQEMVDDERMNLLLYCLSSDSETNEYNRVRDMRFRVRRYVMTLEDYDKASIIGNIEKDGETWFRGYGMANSYSDYDKTETINALVENLLILKYVVPTPNYFDESEKWYEKRNEISEQLEIGDAIWDIVAHEFKSLHADKEVKDDVE